MRLWSYFIVYFLHCFVAFIVMFFYAYLYMIYSILYQLRLFLKWFYKQSEYDYSYYEVIQTFMISSVYIIYDLCRRLIV